MIARQNNHRSGGGEIMTVTTPWNTNRRKKASSHSAVVLVLACFLSSVVSFYAGVFVGMHVGQPNLPMAAPQVTATSRRVSSMAELQTSQRFPSQQIQQPEPKPTNQGGDSIDKRSPNHVRQSTAAPPLRSRESLIRERKLEYLKRRRRETGIFVSALEYVDRDNFLQTFESLGVPFDPTEPRDNDRVMILYSSPSSYPDPESILNSNSTYFETNDGIVDPEHPNRSVDVILSVKEATKNCNNLHVILADHDREHQCMAIVGQYESFHVHKFMRASMDPDPKHNSKDRFEIDPSHPLRPVNRNMKTNGGRSMLIPKDEHIRTNWSLLGSYLNGLEGVLQQLEPLAKDVAGHNTRNTVVIMVCNFGQSELLMNCE